MSKVKSKSPFGPGGLIMTIHSDDDVEDVGNFSSGDEEDTSTKSKNSSQLAKKQQLAIDKKDFFADISEQQKEEVVVDTATTALSARSQAFREKLRARAKEIAEKRTQEEFISSSQKLKALALAKKAKTQEPNSKSGVTSTVTEPVTKIKSTTSDDDDEEEEEEEEDVAGISSSDEGWGDATDEMVDDGDELKSQLNQEIFESGTQKKQSIQDFTEFKLSRVLTQGIKKLNFTKPTPIQAATIPIVLSGSDLLANAVTGSGKTAAFLIPIIERIIHQHRKVSATRAVIITPTRELAEQIHKVAEGLCFYSDVRSACVVGGVSLQAQESQLRSRPDIVVATPGRLIDHLANSRSFDLEDCEVLVLDEADRLLEMGFIDEIKEIVKSCPYNRQTLLFSATMSNDVDSLVHLSLRYPKKISVDQNSSIVDTLTQEFVRIRQDSELVRQAIVVALCKRSFHSRAIIFTRTKAAAHRLMIIFGLQGLNAAELHGNLTQAQRSEALELFRNQEVDYLICTDIASRGIDIKGVQTVINLHVPRELAHYVHRVGRTARAGNKGLAVSIISEGDRRILRDIMKAARHVVQGRVVPHAIITKYSNRIAALEDDINRVLEEEKIDKELQSAEMQAIKAQNMIAHESEIFARPARTWFQNTKDKEAIKAAATLASKGEVLEDKTKKVEDAHSDDDMELSKKLEKDPLRGLSREKRRRKMFAMQAEEAAKETEQRLLDSAAALESTDPTKDNHNKIMSAKETQQAKHTLRMLRNPEFAGKANKREEKRRHRAEIMGEVYDGAGPEAIKYQLQDAIQRDRTQKKRARENADDGNEHGGKKTKFSIAEKDRKYSNASTTQFHGRDDSAGRSRFAESTTKAFAMQGRIEKERVEARKPKKQSGFKSQARFRRR